MNSWLAVFPLPSASPYKFPYSVQNPDTGGVLEIASVEDIWDAVERFQNNRYIYAELICDTRHLICPKAQQDLKRYFYSKEWGVSPYPGSYDDQPATWTDKVEIISHAINEAQTVKAKRDGNKKR